MSRELGLLRICVLLLAVLILSSFSVLAPSVQSCDYLDDDFDHACYASSSWCSETHGSADLVNGEGTEDEWMPCSLGFDECPDETLCRTQCGQGDIYYPTLPCPFSTNRFSCEYDEDCSVYDGHFPTACINNLCEPTCNADSDCDNQPGCAGGCKCLPPLSDTAGDKSCYPGTADYDGDYVAMDYDCNMYTAVCAVATDNTACGHSREHMWGWNDMIPGVDEWAVEDCWNWCIDNDDDGYCSQSSVRYTDWGSLSAGDWYRLAREDSEEAGKVAQPFDCDDNNDAAMPGGDVDEVCNGVDDDCDGLIDDCDGYPTDTYFCDPNAAPTDPCVEFDADGDGFKNDLYGCVDCDDCDDDPVTGPLVYPGADEFPPGDDNGDGTFVDRDNNCNGYPNEGLDGDDDGVSNEDEDQGCDVQVAPAGDTSAINPATGCVYVLVGWG